MKKQMKKQNTKHKTKKFLKNQVVLFPGMSASISPESQEKKDLDLGNITHSFRGKTHPLKNQSFQK